VHIAIEAVSSFDMIDAGNESLTDYKEIMVTVIFQDEKNNRRLIANDKTVG